MVLLGNQKKLVEQEADELRKKLATMLTGIEKNDRRDTGIFEHFMGAPPKSATDQKIMTLISSIEN